MSTQCRIAKQLNDGSFIGVTVHYDGYPSGVGNEILRHFNSSDGADFLTRGHIETIRRGEVKFIEEDDPGAFEFSLPEEIQNWEGVLEGKDKNGQYLLGVAHTYIFADGTLFAHYPYCAMDPVPLENYIDCLKEMHPDDDYTW